MCGGTDPNEIAKAVFSVNRDIMLITVLGNAQKYNITKIEIPGKDRETILVEAGKYLGIDTNDHATNVVGGLTLNYENGTFTASGTIQGVISSMQTVQEDMKKRVSIGSLMGRCASKEELIQYETRVKADILEYLKNKNYIEPGQDEELFVRQIYCYYKDSQAITVTVSGTYNLETPGDGASCKVKNVQINLTRNDVNNAVNAKDVEDVDTSTYYVDKYGQKKEVETDESGRILEEEEDLVDAGGILLSPVFYLINFVADAVISVTGSVMYPSAQGLDFGLGILTNTKPENKYENTVEKEVSTTSFLPTNFSGAFSSDGSSKYQYPHINYTPEEIFAGKVELLSIDFITGKGYDGEEIKNSGWTNIRKVISQWYQILRMIAIIGLLSVLIYTGIKIIISANAKDKAKYKEWIMNWLMAVAILFFMHYIMAFIVSVIGEFSKLMTESSAGITVIPSDDSANTFQTNLMGLVRFMIQSESFYIKVAYEVMYIALIWYTLKFTITYLKRVLNMAFLTLIAPIVALTYPIDKLNDGKAQGFDMWLKEYIFNALLQPMHCILYYILVGSAVDIATTNPLYGIAVLAFMSQAENLLKKIFGFDKAGGGTVGGMANAFAAGAIASKISKMAKLPKGNAGKGGDGSVNDDLFKSLKATDKNSDKDDALFDGSVDKNKNMLDAGNKETEKDDKNTPTPISNNGQNVGQNGAQSNIPQTRNSSNNASATPIRSMSGKVGRGATAVGKRLAKPIWDFDHSGKYNRKRLRRKIGRAAFGAALGVGAAAVQAGISITDGKYNPMEGMASFAAGYAGAGKITKGIRSLGETYKEGTLPDNIDERKKEIMKRAQKEWADREDVIKHNKNKYSSDDRKNVLGIQKQLLEQGVTDLKEMDDCIKYIKSSNNGSLDSVSPDMVRKSRVMHDFSGDANVQKVMYDPSKRKDYIDSVAKDDREKKILENKFNEAIKYNNIVNKK